MEMEKDWTAFDETPEMTQVEAGSDLLVATALLDVLLDTVSVEDLILWVLEQVRDLDCVTAPVENAPITRVGAAVRASTEIRKQDAILKVVRGYLNLKESQRAEITSRLWHAAWPMLKGADARGGLPELIGQVSQQMSGILSSSGFADLEQLERGDVSSQGLSKDSCQKTVGMPPLTFNLVRVGLQVGIVEVPDVQTMADNPALMIPAIEAGVVRDLRVLMEFITGRGEEERKEIVDAAAVSRIVEGGRLMLVEKALLPNGYVDRLSQFLWMLTLMHWFACICVVYPILEIVVSFLLPHCRVPLKIWLMADAVLWLVSTTSLLYVYAAYCRVLRMLRRCEEARLERNKALNKSNALNHSDADPFLTQQSADPEVTVDEQLTFMDSAKSAFLEQFTIITVCIAAFFCALALITGAIAAVLAFVEIIVALCLHCNATTVLVTQVFVGIRIFSVVLSACFVSRAVQEALLIKRRWEGKTDARKPEIPAAKKGYGTMGGNNPRFSISD